MDNLLKTKDTENYQYRLRHWPNNSKPYILSRLDKNRAKDSKTAIRVEELAHFDTLEEANLYMERLK